MNQKARKYLSILIALAMVFTSITWPQMGQNAKAAELSEEEKVAVPDKGDGSAGHETIQEFSLKQLQEVDPNITYEKVKGTKVKVYIHVTESHEYSYLKVRGGDISTITGSFSNKELVGPLCTRKSSSNSPYILHLGYGTEAGYGSGVGEKGSGNYLFADTAVTKGSDDKTAGIRLTRRTTDVHAYIIGIVFYDSKGGNVASLSLSAPSADGTVASTAGAVTIVTTGGAVAVTKGFDAEAANIESWQLDETDEAPKSEEEKRADAIKAIQPVIESAKKYTTETILDQELWKSLQDAITAAEEVIKDDASTSDEIKQAKNALESEIDKAVDETDRVETRAGILSAVTYCKGLKEENYTAESFAKLAPAIKTAEEAYAKTDDTRLGYKEKRDALEAVRVALVPKVSEVISNPSDFRILSKSEVVKEMGAGINLGNTMDGGLYNVSETSWQAYRTTKAYIKALHDAGYNTVRIPVTWGEWINDDYSVKESWLGRVQEIVDYCVDQDMYAIINIHHDGAANHDDRGNNPECWLNTYEQDIETVYQKYQGVWKTIADRFKDYDEHLIFESMNEVTDSHGKQTNEDTAVLNALNQLFVNTVRATGSNNLKRWLAITGRFATYSTGTVLPEDTLADKGEAGTTRMMFSVHIYKSNTSVRWSLSNLKEWKSSLESSTNNVKKLDPEMPLYVGEYGVRTQKQDGSATGYNNTERALNYEFCAAVADYYGAVPVVWDQGTGNYSGVKTETGLFTDWNRPALAPVYDNVVYATIRGSLESGRSTDVDELMDTIYKSYGHADTSDNSVSTDPEITPATDIQITAAEGVIADGVIQLKVGERVTLNAVSDSSRDIVLWSTDDDSVATVYNGQIHAKASGVTKVYATTQLSDVVKEYTVNVPSDRTIIEGDAIILGKTEYSVEEGETAALDVKLKSSGSMKGLTFTSSNEDVMTISKSGVISAKAQGAAYIVISSKTGVAEIVKVTVPRNKLHESVSLALMVYNGVGNPGQPITVTEDGQYTLTWDLAKDKPNDNFDFKNVGSIYIRDQNPAARVVKKANIRYDEIKVNDQALTITKPDFKSAIKGGVFDTGDPINVWDGSAVAEIEKGNTVKFTTVENPTKISVTFTLEGLQFAEIKTLKKNEATAMESATETDIAIAAAGETKELDVKLTPEDTDSFVTFYATNPSVADVSNKALAVDEEGHVKVEIQTLAKGTTQIIGITENGLKVTYNVYVEVDEPPLQPTIEPTTEPTTGPSIEPTAEPTTEPTEAPTKKPSTSPSADPGQTVPTPAGDEPAPSAVVPAPTQAVTTQPASTPAVTSGGEEGTSKTQTVDGAKYTVTSTSAKTVEYMGPTSKKKTSVTIPATVKVKIKGKKVKCKVTSIAKNAFKNNTKLKKVTIGKNVKTIKANAFSGCKNLKQIIIKSTVLKKVDKNALKGIHPDCRITVPKKKQKDYTKLLKGKGQPTTVKIVS